MGQLKNVRGKLSGLYSAAARYPLTALFLFFAMAFLSFSFQIERDYSKEFLSCAFGAVLSAFLQALHERFFYKPFMRFALIGCGVVIPLGYYLLIKPAQELGEEIGIRTLLVAAALLSAYLWVPSIHSKVTFNESFFAAFKAFFHSLLFSGVLFLGCAFILGAFDLLIIPLRSVVYSHAANSIFVFFAPLFFLSLIPVYPGEKEHKEEFDRIAEKTEALEKAAACPKFLEVLLCYVVLPLLAVFTIILLLYILKNIKTVFWSEGLLGPLITSYAVLGILLYLLTSRLENRFAFWYRRVFPKLLLLFTAFQTTALVLELKETGITHTKYFMILFSIYAFSSALAMCFIPVKKNGVFAAMLILFFLICVVPPLDAFSVSRVSQENRLKNVLLKNAMLENNYILARASVSKEDKKKMITAAEYLSRMGYTDRISWMPKGFSFNEDFYNTFGFDRYESETDNRRVLYVALKPESAITISGYDAMTHAFLNDSDSGETRVSEILSSDRLYFLDKVKDGGELDFILTQENQELLRWNTQEIFSRYRIYTQERTELSKEEAIFVKENEEAKIMFVVREANINFLNDETTYFVNLDILILIK